MSTWAAANAAGTPAGAAAVDPSADLLRFATAGSVDDGKSTLIGRLLHDSKQVLTDQLEHVQATSARRGDGYVDLALLTDGLRAEREQGITIDVAYRHFATARRRFIIADTPGHAQYTRNMVTGASTAELAVVLVDARRGVLEQSRRHAFLASLLRIPHIVVCVNKMDLVGFDEAVFDRVVTDFTAWAARLDFGAVDFIPVSALHGDNVVQRSERMRWYEGPSLLSYLEEVPIGDGSPSDDDLARGAARFPVQWVVRPRSESHPDYRGYAGQLAAGVLRVGQEVVVLPSGVRTSVAAIETPEGPREEAMAPMSITARLADELDVSRGEMVCGVEDPPVPARALDATVCWMADAPLRAGGRYLVKHTTRTVRARVEELLDRVDVDTLQREAVPGALGLNEIGHVRLRTGDPLLVDPYHRQRATGSFILIDEATNETVGAGMVEG